MNEACEACEALQSEVKELQINVDRLEALVSGRDDQIYDLETEMRVRATRIDDLENDVEELAPARKLLDDLHRLHVEVLQDGQWLCESCEVKFPCPTAELW